MTYKEAYEAAQSGKRVRLILPARVRGETHVFIMKGIGDYFNSVIMHIQIETGFSPTLQLSVIASEIRDCIISTSESISDEDLDKWEVVE